MVAVGGAAGFSWGLAQLVQVGQKGGQVGGGQDGRGQDQGGNLGTVAGSGEAGGEQEVGDLGGVRGEAGEVIQG